LHQLYLGYPDSAAARGLVPEPSTEPSPAPGPSRRPKRPARTVTSLRVPGPVKRAVRLVPGVHW
jgi:hypothetical protein